MIISSGISHHTIEGALYPNIEQMLGILFWKEPLVLLLRKEQSDSEDVGGTLSPSIISLFTIEPVCFINDRLSGTTRLCQKNNTNTL